MRRIAIVGAGQAGLLIAAGLLARNYHVTLVTNRAAEDIRAGNVTSSQCMFDASLEIERELGLNFWEDTCPPVEGIGLNAVNPDAFGEILFAWAARLDKKAQSVDQRLKMPVWIDEIVRRGAELRIQDVGIAELEVLAAEHDLVLLAAGKGEVVRQFKRDAARSSFDQPMRALALTYVTGMTPMPDYSRVNFNLIPGIGEYFVFPALTLSGPCEIMVFEGIPGGPMDCWQDITSPEQHLETSLGILEKYIPWEAERCRNIALTDAKGILSGRFPPTVREPVLTLPSGRLVFGVGDAVVVNDPITGQGANNAAKAGKVYLDAILARGAKPFNAAWMNATFENFWAYAQHVVSWTNSLLTPPPPHVLKLLASATGAPELASLISNGFDDPRRFHPWWFDPAASEALLGRTLPRAA